ncbi:hypothetical protein HMPREF1861_01493 [Corynebacterium kroppenstedtii]|nr:hypothetical protein HMPREF1861_01493 [Corynebacterium kroppenstedtii]
MCTAGPIVGSTYRRLRGAQFLGAIPGYEADPAMAAMKHGVVVVQNG